MDTSEPKWDDISKVEADPVRIVDPGEGGAVVLRHFFFKKTPTPPGMRAPTKQQIFGQFKNLIFTQLWADGLQPREDRNIEIYTMREARKASKTLFAEMYKNNADFVIMVLAEPRRGIQVHDTPTKVT